MTYLITGCYGFIGKRISLYLLKLGHQVIGMDIEDKQLIRHKNFIFVNFLFPDCIDTLSKTKVTIIYHFAWYGVSTSDKNNIDKQFVNFDITYNVLRIAKVVGAERIIIPGSVSEFSRCKKKVSGMTKDSPADLYAATKSAIRSISFEFCKTNDIGLNWLLITSVYGGERTDNNLLTYTIRNLLQNKDVETTKLEQKWDYIYIDDLIKALYIIGLKGKKYGIYPIGSGRCENLSFYVKYIARLLNKVELLKIGKVEYKNKYIDNSVVDITKIEKLGFKCEKPFEERIVEVIDYYKKIMS